MAPPFHSMDNIISDRPILIKGPFTSCPNDDILIYQPKIGGFNMRIWGKIFKNNNLIKDTVIELNDDTISRTQKVYECLNQICYEFDLAKPIWLDVNIKDFQRDDRCRFRQDSFIESIDFDFLELHVIEE